MTAARAVADLEPPHARAASEVARALESHEKHGLDEAEATSRLGRLGPNVVARVARPSYLQLAARQLADPLVALLIAAAAVSAAIGEVVEAGAIGAIVVLNAILGFVQEAGAERALVALRNEVAQVADVVRSGREREIPAEEVVPGDLIVLREGDRAPADARLVLAERLEMNESALTGESLPVEKDPAPVPADAPLAERPPMVYAGSAATRGHGRALVTATGEATELGRVAALADTAKPPPTPLQRRLGALARALGVLGVLVTLLLAAVLLARGEPLREAFLIGVAVAVAAVPEGLAATVTIALALGARALAGRGAIVRRLAAIETLGRTSVICTDKTGTLTENRLRLAVALPAAGRDERNLLAAAVLASSAELVDAGGTAHVLGDPVEGALLLAARERGLEREALVAARRLLYELPFDATAKRMTVVYEEGRGRRAFVKGAPEELFARAREPDATLAGQAETLAGEGLRVLAVAERHLAGRDGDDPERGLDLVGLVALHDPLRPSAAPAVEVARRAGIEVRMVTGDHPATATTVGRALGLPEDAVHARVAPEGKLRLVESLQAAGETVAVTGDGVNDAPALRTADVGVAMGRSGTEAAREAADIVLTDDDFATIVAAIGEGRRITDNVRKVVAFLLSANLGEVLLFAVAIVAGLGVPMTVVQVLTVNVLTDGLPALALTRDPAAPESMRRRPERGGALFSPALVTALAGAGALVGLAALGAFLTGRALAPEQAQTMTYATVALAELAAVFSFRSVTDAAWRMPRNPYLLAGVAASLAVLAVTIFLPLAREASGTVALGAAEAGLVLGYAVLPLLVLELAKALRRG